MPVKFDEYQASEDASGWVIDPDSNAYALLAFLAAQPETGFAPNEIHEATDLPRRSVGTTLRRLEKRGHVRHKEPYWAVSRRGVAAYETVLTSVQTVEATTTYGSSQEDPDDYRIGLDAVTRESVDESG